MRRSLLAVVVGLCVAGVVAVLVDLAQQVAAPAVVGHRAVLEEDPQVERGAVGERTEVPQAEVRARELIAAAKQEVPTLMQFPYAPVKYERPFLVRAMWHDGQFTYLQTDARELPALYEEKDGKPSLVNFQVQRGTYVVPKVLERGYLALGNAKLTFDLRER